MRPELVVDADVFLLRVPADLRGATQVSQVSVPQWIGQSEAYYLFAKIRRRADFLYYGSYRDQFNPGLNGS